MPSRVLEHPDKEGGRSIKPWPKNPLIYEINTWVWLNELSQKAGHSLSLARVPDDEWDIIAGHKQGTMLFNTITNHYLKGTKWMKNALAKENSEDFQRLMTSLLNTLINTTLTGFS